MLRFSGFHAVSAFGLGTPTQHTDICCYVADHLFVSSMGNANAMAKNAETFHVPMRDILVK
jgi:hypothetical protein